VLGNCRVGPEGVLTPKRKFKKGPTWPYLTVLTSQRRIASWRGTTTNLGYDALSDNAKEIIPRFTQSSMPNSRHASICLACFLFANQVLSPLGSLANFR
jgi:hypothetical protein